MLQEKNIMTADIKLIQNCFKRTAQIHDYWETWITADTWVTIIKQEFAEISLLSSLTAEALNKAITRDKSLGGIDNLKFANVHGIYKFKTKSKIVTKNKEGIEERVGGNKNITGYFITKLMEKPVQPGGSTIWMSTLCQFQSKRTRNNFDISIFDITVATPR